jgi:hypothetical protein
MTDKTARHYRDNPTLPSARQQARPPRDYRTRTDPFADVWPAVEAKLQAEPRLKAKTLFDWLRREHPGRFLDSHRRTFERRVNQWRALHGPNKAILFRQVHEAGQLAASDFTRMSELKITIAGQPFDHLVYHFVLTYSNWESVSVCASESFEALSEGLQNALWELGGVPGKHRSDSLSAAVNNHSVKREFQARYRDLLTYYGLAGQRINVRQAHENGDAESSHGHFKTAVDQALLLRGSRDFTTREEYELFLKNEVKTRNAGRRDRFAEELAVLRPLPDSRLPSCLKMLCRVDSGSLIHLHRNVYSVHSRLIGQMVEARLFADRVEVWYADRCVDTLPRLVGRDRHAVNYRHVIDSLMRKPGAFAQYAYRDDLFPTTRFRMAYDRFCETSDDRQGAKDYLKILQHAAHTSEVAVDDALRVLLNCDEQLSPDAVLAMAKASTEIPAPTRVVVEPPDLKEFDALLTEETDGEDPQTDPDGITRHEGESAGDGATDGAVTAPTAADGSGSLLESGRASGDGELELPAVSGIADEPGNRGENAGSHPSDGECVAAAVGQIVGRVCVVAAAASHAASVPVAPRRRVLEASGERVGVRQTGFREDTRGVCGGRAVGVAGSSGAVRDVQFVGAGSARRETRSSAREVFEEAVRLRGVGDRRLGLRAAESRGDGGVVHAVGGALRTRQCAVDEQPAVLGLGCDLQGSDDNGRRDRPSGAPQRDRGDERAELSAGNGEECESRVDGDLWRTHPNDRVISAGKV